MNKKFKCLLLCVLCITGAAYADVAVQQKVSLGVADINFSPCSFNISEYPFLENISISCMYIQDKKNKLEYGIGIGVGLSGCGPVVYLDSICGYQFFAFPEFSMELLGEFTCGMAVAFYDEFWPLVNYSINSGVRFFKPENKSLYGDFLIGFCRYNDINKNDANSLTFGINIGYMF